MVAISEWNAVREKGCFRPHRLQRSVLVAYKLLVFLYQTYITDNILYEIKWNANLMQLGNFIDVFLALYRPYGP